MFTYSIRNLWLGAEQDRCQKLSLLVWVLTSLRIIHTLL